MNQKPPALHLHSSGHYFCKWGGRFHYFGKNKTQARAQYLQSLQAWAEWRANRNARRFPPMSKAHTVLDLVERFLEYKTTEGGKGRRRHYENHLRRFNAAFHGVRADMIRAVHLHALKEDMIRAGYHPKTINHDLSSVRSLFNWASALELVPAVNLSVVRTLPLPPAPDKAMTPEAVQDMVDKAGAKLAPWLAVTYLAMLRPSETVKVVNQQGEWEEFWLFRLHHGKVDYRSGEFRRIVFSTAALYWLSRCEPFWTRQDSFYRATERAGLSGGPHPLRHSAATHLAQRGVARSEIDLLLGHLPPRVSRIYDRIDWQPLRPKVGRLMLRYVQ